MDIFKEITGAEIEGNLDIHHNYAVWENHFGHNVIIHRKGATRAREGEQGIIPGSQGTASYIVKGKGNKESFMSCSHGAGRRMGRGQATRTLNLEEEVRKMDEKGIIHGIRNTSDLDEAAGAYKSIDQVMAEQTDLVDIKIKLEPWF
jgi:tRNA-splicing ligase RtcB